MHVFGRLHRRALAGIVLLAMLLLTACGGGGPSGNATSTSVAVGTTRPYVSLDPARTTSGSNYSYLFLLYARLIDHDPATLEPRPGLAESWDYSADQMTLTLKLREGLTFHDGTPVDAAAVKKSLDRFIELGQLNRITTVSEVVVVDPTTVELKQNTPNSLLVYQLMDLGGMIVAPSAIDANPDDVTQNPIGAGPYKFVSAVPGSSLELERFDGYYEAGRPAYQKLQYRIFDNSISMVQALRSGTIQVADQIASQDVETLRTDPSLEVSITPSIYFHNMYFNASKGPLADVLIRKAINYALNRDELVQLGTAGLGAPASQPFPKEYALHDAAVESAYPYDPERARSLLAEAGAAGGVSLDCVAFSGVGYETVGPAVIEQLKAVGINMSLQILPLAQALDQFYRQDGPDCFLSTWTGQLDPHSTLIGLYGSQSYYNAGKIRFIDDQLLDNFRAQSTLEGRKAVAAEIIRSATDVAATAPLYFRPSIVARSKNVGSFEQSLFQQNWVTLAPAATP